jgi:polyhydroxyalkanoate synthesis regulator phasin
MKLEDVRKTVEATLETLTPARAQQLAKSLTEPGAAKDQVTKAAAELMQWSSRNRERLQSIVRREIAGQLGTIGVATRTELDALTKRVRTLERAGKTAASGGKTASRSKAASRGGRAATSTARSSSKSRAKRPAAPRRSRSA